MNGLDVKRAGARKRASERVRQIEGEDGNSGRRGASYFITRARMRTRMRARAHIHPRTQALPYIRSVIHKRFDTHDSN